MARFGYFVHQSTHQLMPIAAPDLRKQPPRSPRVRLGGYALLPRMLDKGRATLAGKVGEYKFGCPLDQRFLTFVGLSAAGVKKQIATGKGDGEILKWIRATAKHAGTDPEIRAWSAWQDTRVPGDTEARDFFNELQKKSGPQREDIYSWSDLLDLDDYVSFGGKA